MVLKRSIVIPRPTVNFVHLVCTCQYVCASNKNKTSLFLNASLPINMTVPLAISQKRDLAKE